MTEEKNQKIYDRKKLAIHQDYHKEYDKNGMKNKETFKKWIEAIKKSKKNEREKKNKDDL